MAEHGAEKEKRANKVAAEEEEEEIFDTILRINKG